MRRDESFPNKKNWVIWDFCFHETIPQNESFKNRSTKQIHKTNLSKTGLQNESTKQIFWNQYGFANPKPRINMDLGLCTKDSSGFVRIRWIRENRLNLLKISLWNESTKWFVIHDTKQIRICFVRHESNLFEVRIHYHDTKRIHGFAKRTHIFTNLLYNSRILSFDPKLMFSSEIVYFKVIFV